MHKLQQLHFDDDRSLTLLTKKDEPETANESSKDTDKPKVGQGGGTIPVGVAQPLSASSTD